MSTKAAILRLLFCTCVTLVFTINAVETRPAAYDHIIEKRSTRAEILGDLTAGLSGILNEDGKDNTIIVQSAVCNCTNHA